MAGAKRDADDPGAIAYRLARGVYDLSQALVRDAAETLTELGLSESLADALWQLDPGQVPMSRGSLAKRLGCDPSNVTFLADRLEERGLVERATDPGDRRVKALKLTPAGVSVRRRLVEATTNGPTFARLSSTQKRQLADLLRQALEGG